MPLEEILKEREKNKGYGLAEISEKTIIDNLKSYQELISFWRQYPDLMIDYYCSLNPNNTFHFYFYQRMALRIFMRHKYIFATFVRAWSKSFMAVMCAICKCILYPGTKMFTTAGVKGQSAEILKSKTNEILKLIPALSREIDWDTRNKSLKTISTKDQVTFVFKNGSYLENVVMGESARGRRYTCGIIEEVINADQDIVSEVIIPTMNVSRMVNGQVDKDEVNNKAQIYITSAGYKNTFSYEKMLQIFCQSIVNPKESMIIGGDWRVPVMEGLLDPNFIETLQADNSFNEASFDREYKRIVLFKYRELLETPKVA